jgi:hypothetical protein
MSNLVIWIQGRVVSFDDTWERRGGRGAGGGPGLARQCRPLTDFPAVVGCGALETRSSCIGLSLAFTRSDAFETTFQLAVLVSSSTRGQSQASSPLYPYSLLWPPIYSERAPRLCGCCLLPAVCCLPSAVYMVVTQIRPALLEPQT